MIFAAIMIGLGTIMAQIADKMTPALAHTAPKARSPPSRCRRRRAVRSLSIAP
jgi:aspartyl protease family protein